MNPSQKPTAKRAAPVPATAKPAAVKAAGQDSLRLRFASNPFRNTMRALGVIFQANPLSTLTITPLALLVALIALLPGVLVFGLINEALGALVIAVGAAIWLTLIVAAILGVQSASYHGKTITGKEALKALPAGRLAGLLGIMLLSIIAISLGLILLVIPGLIVMARLSLAPYVYFDEKRGVMASLKRSWRLSKGHTWELLGTYVAQALTIGSSGGLLTFVGGSAGLADRYYTLRAHEKAKVTTGPVHYSNYLSVILLILGALAYAGTMAVISMTVNKAVDQQIQTETDNPFTVDDPFMTDPFENSFPGSSDEEML